MAKNAAYKVTVIADGREIEVYKLANGNPTPEHIWCNCSGCKETFKETELKDFQKTDH